MEATAGTPSTSVFKVDSTGLTTIAGQGNGGAIISDRNAGTTSTLSVTNKTAALAAFTGAILSVDTTDLAEAGTFSLIDARIKTVSKFTVAASGKTTIAGGGLDILATGTPVFTVATSGATTIGGGGLSVKGGLTVVDTGVTVTAGDVLISSTTQVNGLSSAALMVKGGGSFALSLYVGGSLSNNSDRRLKTSIQPLKSSREFIQQLRPVRVCMAPLDT
ncbi:hypothetical protein DVH05_008426 [Phytophthora capsici]|nr:hypothetical protein DVH05_008426 [Phytophthora capsici]